MREMRQHPGGVDVAVYDPHPDSPDREWSCTNGARYTDADTADWIRIFRAPMPPADAEVWVRQYARESGEELLAAARQLKLVAKLAAEAAEEATKGAAHGLSHRVGLAAQALGSARDRIEAARVARARAEAMCSAVPANVPWLAAYGTEITNLAAAAFAQQAR